MASVDDSQLAGFGNLAREADTARAQDAPLLVQHHVWADRARFLPLGFVLVETWIIKPMFHVVVLKFTLAGLVADRAIERMVREQKLQDVATVLQSFGCP